MASIVTLGAAGAVGWHGGVRRRLDAPMVEAVDTVAAGDSFVGAFAAALQAGFGFSGALQRGLAAGSLACTIAGAQPSVPRREAIEPIETCECSKSVNWIPSARQTRNGPCRVVPSVRGAIHSVRPWRSAMKYIVSPPAAWISSCIATHCFTAPR